MEDPEKKILEWCGHLAVPRLVDEKAYDKCRGCQTKIGGFLSSSKTHHCRLCGHMYCSSCTAKYHVPLIFRIKNKEGPARVCMACVEGCMAEKAKAEAPKPKDLNQTTLVNSALTTSTISSNLLSMARTVEIAPPDVWEEESSFVACPKCGTKKCKTHNCRCCGKLFCSDCTSKMEIPPYFEKKKGKSGPSRVCDGCRYKIVSGAKFVEKLSAAALAAAAGAGGGAVKKVPPPPPAGFLGQVRRPSHSFANKCSQAGCLAQAANKAGTCAQHSSSSSIFSAPSPEQTITIKREGTGEVVSKLHLANGGDTTLNAIDILLKKTSPQSDNYCYVFRGEPIPDAFHLVFLAKHLGSILFIRPKRKNLLHIDEEDMTLGGSLNGSGMVSDGGVVSSANNPFKLNPELEQKRAAAKAEAEKRSKPLVFKAPDKKHIKSPPPAGQFGGSSSSGAKKVPPPPPGSSSTPASGAMLGAGAALASGMALQDVFKQRAKQIFGQN